MNANYYYSNYDCHQQPPRTKAKESTADYKQSIIRELGARGLGNALLLECLSQEQLQEMLHMSQAYDEEDEENNDNAHNVLLVAAAAEQRESKGPQHQSQHAADNDNNVTTSEFACNAFSCFF